jgi:hypothetical protein
LPSQVQLMTQRTLIFDALDELGGEPLEGSGFETEASELTSIALALMPPNGGANRHARRERLTPKRDFRQEVTENIIRILEQGTAHGRNRGQRASSKRQITQRRINHAGAAGLQQAQHHA